MKLTKKHLEKLLSAVGVDAVEIVDDDSDADYKQDDVLQLIDAAREKVLRPKIEAEVKKTAEVEAKGRVGGALERILKRTTGIPVAEFTAEMTDEDKIAAALNHREKTLGKDVADLRDEMDKMAAAHAAALTGLETTYEGRLSAEKERFVEREIIEYIASDSKEYPFPDDADRMHLAKDLLGYIKQNAHVHWNEDSRKPEYRKKDAPETPLYNESGTQIRTTRDFAEDKYKPMGKAFWQADMSGKNPVDEMARLKLQEYNQQPAKAPDSIDKLNADINTYIGAKAGV